MQQKIYFILKLAFLDLEDKQQRSARKMTVLRISNPQTTPPGTEDARNTRKNLLQQYIIQ